MFQQNQKRFRPATAAAVLTLGALLIDLGVADAGRLTDTAGEGVTNNYGECWNAAGGATKPMAECGDAASMAADADSDGDGVPDAIDQCPGTPPGVAVDAVGCPKDSDGDGVPDYLDKCPGTPTGAKVDANGCEIMLDVTINVTADYFDFDSAKLKPAMMSALDDVAEKVKLSNGDERLAVIGHTDSTGPDAYNLGLSERRAQAVADYLVGQGVAADHITASGAGESQPVADNDTKEGRAMNRRVEIETR